MPQSFFKLRVNSAHHLVKELLSYESRLKTLLIMCFEWSTHMWATFSKFVFTQSWHASLCFSCDHVWSCSKGWGDTTEANRKVWESMRNLRPQLKGDTCSHCIYRPLRTSWIILTLLLTTCDQITQDTRWHKEKTALICTVPEIFYIDMNLIFPVGAFYPLKEITYINHRL